MTSRSISVSRNATAPTCPTPRFTFSTPVISRWTRLQMKLRRWLGTLSALPLSPRGGKRAEVRVCKPARLPEILGNTRSEPTMRSKVVLVTGADGGLGNYVTQAFLDAGATVIGTSRKIRQ